MTRGIYTPPAFSPKASSERNQAAMQQALSLVDAAIKLYDKAVWRARNQQARLIVDALYGRYDYQFKRNNTELSFGEWLIAKRRFVDSYVRLSAEPVLWSFAGIVHEAMTDKRFRLFGQQDLQVDWLTPLIEHFVNRRVVEDNFIVLVRAYTVPLTEFREALPSLNFGRQWVPSHHAA